MQSDLAKQGCSENSITSRPECARSHVFVQKAGFFLSKPPFYCPFYINRQMQTDGKGAPLQIINVQEERNKQRGDFL